MQEGHAADDLSKDGASEVGTDDRLEHVDLEQTRQLDCRREFREKMRYAEVAFGIGADAGAIERVHRCVRLIEPLHHLRRCGVIAQRREHGVERPGTR